LTETERVTRLHDQSLENIDLFRNLPAQERSFIEARCRWLRFKRGQRILEHGSFCNEVFFVVDGSVVIVNEPIPGREVAFTTIESGNYFGEIAAIDGGPRSASVVAKESCVLACLASERFLELLQSNAGITFEVLQRLTGMIRAGDVRIVELSTLAARQRVFAELLRMAQPDAAIPGQWVVRPLPPLREIATRVSTTRETVVRAFAQLYKTGTVSRKGRNLYLLDRKAVEDLARAC